MRRCLDPRILLCLCVPFLLAFAPHDGVDSGKNISNSAPPGIGGDGPWDSRNMILVGRLALDEIGADAANIMGNDCWGWTDPLDGKEYAICGLTNATSFVDISDPADPKYLGKLMTQTGNSAWRDMKVYNNHVFIVSDGNGNHGMQIFDLTELRTADPNNPGVFSNTAWYDDETGSCHNIAINEATGYAYLVGSRHPDADGGLQVVDISNPIAPVPAGEYAGDGYTHDCQVVVYDGPDNTYDGQEIAFCCNEDTVTIVNVTDKNNFVQISRNGYAEDNYTHQGWLSEDHRYFYMGDELDESNRGGPTRTHIFDCQDLDAPVYMGYYSGETNAIDHNLYVKGNRLFCGNYSAGLRLLEADPNNGASLDEVAYFDSYNSGTGVNFDGVWSVYPYFASDIVLINDRQNGMFLVKTSPISIDFPNGRPEMINPVGTVEFPVVVSDFDGTAAPGTGMLHVDIGDGNGFRIYPMNEVSPGNYEAKFPPTDCGSDVKYFVSADGTDGTMMCMPSTAPEIPYTAFSALGLETVFEEDFETDTGWTVSGDALDGQWERAIPAGGGDRSDPPTDGDGSGNCFVTDNEDGNSDVDDGSTVLTSAILDATVPTGEIAVISYYRWYANDGGGSPASDIFVVDISNDGGASWINLETVGPSGAENSGGWFNKRFRIDDFLTPTNQMRLRFTVSDLGGGSVVEAGVDGVAIQTVKCPIEVNAQGQKLLDGVPMGGASSDIHVSDDLDYEIAPSPTSNPFKQRIQLVLLTESPIDGVTALSFRCEATAIGGPASDVTQRIELYNVPAKSWEEIDSRPSSDNDDVIQVAATGDVSRFVHPLTDEMVARVTWETPDFTGAPFNWTVDADHLSFFVYSETSGGERSAAGPEKPNQGEKQRKERGFKR